MRGLFWIHVATAAAIVTTGCRDFRDSTGARFADRHLMAGRPTSQGGPSLTDAELDRGWVVLHDEDLLPLRDMLRSSLRLRARLAIDAGGTLPGTVDLYGLGTGVVPNPDFSTLLAPPADFSAPFTGINSTQALLEEIGLLCASPLIPRASLGTACDAFSFNLGFSPNPIDGVEIEADFANINLGWMRAGRFHATATTLTSNTFPSMPTGLYPTPGGGYDAVCRNDSQCGYGLRCAPDEAYGRGRCVCDADHACPQAFSCNDDRAAGEGVGLCDWVRVPCTSHLDCVSDATMGPADAECSGEGYCTRRVFWSWSEDESLDHPVLAVDLELDGVDNDPDDALSFLVMAANLQSVRTRLRLQAIPCSSPGCTSVSRTFAGYRGPSPDGDLYDYGSGLSFSARGELTDYAVELIPAGLACIVTLGVACAAIESRARSQLETGLRGVATSVGNIAGALPNAPRLSRFSGRETGDDGIEQMLLNQTFAEDRNTAPLPVADQPPGVGTVRSAWVEMVASNTRIDRANTTVRLGGSTTTLSLLDDDGAASSSLSRILSRGGRLVEVGLEADVLRQVCGEDPRVAVTGSCATSPEQPICIVCETCAGSPSRLCDFSGDAVGVPINASEEVISGFTVLDATPELARLIDMMFGTAEQVRGIYTGPLDRLLPQYQRYNDIVYCDDRGGGRCPYSGTGESRVALRFSPDRDLDGTPDAFDGCPDDPLLGEDDPDSDRDGHADACDLCPLHPGHNGDYDGDETGDVCDCDSDGDLCNQWAIATPVEPPADWTGDSPVERCTISAIVWDQEPRYPDDGSDLDGDGYTTDCDGDDDGDLIFEDGASDGLDEYSPCDGATSGCDDNCPETPNSDQSDRNSDGLGDECDPICGPSSPAWHCDSSAGAFMPEVGIGIPIDLIPRFEPGCINCVLGLVCAAFVPAWSIEWPGAQGCMRGPAGIEAFGVSITLSALVQAAGLGKTARLSAVSVTDDIDGDGISEVVAGIPAAPGEPGAVVLIGSASKSVLWRRTDPQVGKWSFGSSVIARDGLVWVGAPGVSGGGRVFLLEAATGRPLSAFGAPDKGDDGFGSTLSADHSRVYVGAPFALGGAGRIWAYSIANWQLEQLYEGPMSNAHLGAGPIGTVDHGDVRYLLAGSPSALQGAGMLVRFDLEWGKVADVRLGDAGDLLGASIALYPARSHDGRWEGFVGAPGALGGRGQLYALTGEMGWMTTDVTGVEPGDHFAARLLLGEPGQLYVGASGPTFSKASWPGVWMRTDGWSPAP